MKHKHTEYGIVLIRIGLAGVLLWFGAQQLLNPSHWIGFVPPFIESLTSIAPEITVFLNGTAELIFGTLLLFGLFTRVSALIMGLHLVGIAFSLGHTAIAVRDWGLAFAFIGLALISTHALSLDSLRARRAHRARHA